MNELISGSLSQTDLRVAVKSTELFFENLKVLHSAMSFLNSGRHVLETFCTLAVFAAVTRTF